MNLGNFKKVNKLVISDNVFVILGYLDDYVSKKLYKVALAICVTLVYQPILIMPIHGGISFFIIIVISIQQH